MAHVFIVSDGTGRTATQALRAALTQFTDAVVHTELRSEVRTAEQVEAVVEEAAAVAGLIVHTLVSHELRQVLIRASRIANVEAIDLMGPLLARLSEKIANSPSERPGLFRSLNEGYFRRIETMEFAFRHDDGQRIHDLHEAEIVLLGVSRTFKTPLSIYLAFKGWYVANVPIVMDLPPPEALFTLPPGNVFCLTTNPRHLAALRHSRHTYLKESTGGYADVDLIRRELMYAHKVFARQPQWPVLEVTNKPIEEISSEILALRGRKNRKEP
jgi:regulator of PEP synthase PpsR (kinase-PPPase family)